MVNSINILKNTSILYVKNQEASNSDIFELLKSFTKHIYIANDGKDGLEQFQKNIKNINLIISDINIPILNGLELSKEIKNTNQNIPIILTSELLNKEHLLESIDIGINKYILKPIDNTNFLQAISQSLHNYELKELFIEKITKLPNRDKLKKDINETDDILMAFFDIDNFLAFNDLFGDDIGDEILVELSNKLKAHFSSNKYSIYKLDIDKYVVVSINSDENIREFYEFVRLFIRNIENQPLNIKGYEIDINLTVGISREKGILTYKYAQRAMRYARTKFKKIMIYDDSFNIQKSFENNIKWLKKLRTGFKENRFKAYFQPIVDTKTKKIDKYEALIRYIKEDGTEIGPYSFLDIAKKTKQYSNIIKVVLNDALKLIKESNKKVSINISYLDISNNKIISFISRFLKRQKLEHTRLLSFEILESEEITDFKEVSEFINEVKKFDCTVGIDDFGTGYSNFHLLSELKIDFIKIDSSLIKNIHTSKNLYNIVKTISNIAKDLNIETIAEFVENKEIYNKVKELNIDYSQGYYFSKPISYDSVQ